MQKVRSGLLVLSVFIVSLALVCSCSQSDKTPAKTDHLSPRHKTICLNMIVKDESAVITRSLASALPMIDYWVIVDTGSTDGTQKIIKNFMKEKGVPGELHERPWVNFGHNRNEALELAKDKADYVLFLDADDFLAYEPDFALAKLDKDYYYLPIKYSGTSYKRIFIVNNHQDWKWHGVLHEVLCPLPGATHGTLEKVANVVTTDGARSKDPKKFEKDAAVLEAALEKDPNDTRNVFYLAQSYADAGNIPKAIEVYKRRIELGGWQEEVFISLLRIAKLQQMAQAELGLSDDAIIQGFVRACSYNNRRIEPYYYLANTHRSHSNFQKAYEVSQIGLGVPRSTDLLFVEAWIHDYGMLLEFSVNAYWCGKYQECQTASLELLKKKDLPQHIRELVEKNLGFANQKLIETSH